MDRRNNDVAGHQPWPNRRPEPVTFLCHCCRGAGCVAEAGIEQASRVVRDAVWRSYTAEADDRAKRGNVPARPCRLWRTARSRAKGRRGQVTSVERVIQMFEDSASGHHALG
jgi:hypothetical protein